MARESKKAAASGGVRWRWWLAGALMLAAGVSTGYAARKLQQFVTADPQFALSRYQKGALTVEGLNYAARSKVQRVFATDFDRSIFSIPLDERRRRLLAIDWVEDASVSRVWPDRLVVRLRERRPVAFVPMETSVLLIDSHGVLLDQPPQAQFTFPVLRGVRPQDDEAQRQEHVYTYLRVLEDMGYLSKDLSEVNVADPDNIRVVVQEEHRAVELLMGDSNFGARYQNFTKHYAEMAQQYPTAKVFDLRLTDRITAKD
jgi:cell division protein FtsQ